MARSTGSSSNYTAAETESLRKSKALARLYRRVRDVVYPLLRREPHFGPNIKRLRGEFSDFYPFRLGEYRLFSTIDEQDTVVVVADLRSRQASYRRR
ncbi:MAG: type II toxin-antitoxin system RelE/ParE family toxin [Spirochaetaceae bacterium]|nr:type II toxin-antitoxin system RelE/ParE family toxin [Spirochaetaceae bacterium]